MERIGGGASGRERKDSRAGQGRGMAGLLVRSIDTFWRIGYGRWMDIDQLLRRAWAARDQAYAPYSRFGVGAALLGRSGQIYVGCNVENISFGLTMCAERNAVAQAIAAGEREFQAVAIVSDSRVPVSPCGGCRQVLAEFAPDLLVVCENRAGERFTASLAELLPRAKTGILE